MNNLVKLIIFIFFLSIPSQVNGQIPYLDLTPIDTLDFGLDSINSVRQIDYNQDNFNDFYILEENKSYLYDGQTLSLIWESPTLAEANKQNLVYIESLELWRNFTVELFAGNSFQIKWYDIPSVSVTDSFTYNDTNLSYISTPLDVGYFQFSDNEYLYLQMRTTCFFYDYENIGYCYIFDFGNLNIIDEFYCWIPFKNQIITTGQEKYLLHIGKCFIYAQIPGDDLYAHLTHVNIYNEQFNLICSYQCYDHYVSKGVIYYNNNLNSAMLLLSFSEGFKLYPDVLNGDEYYLHGGLDQAYLADFMIFRDSLTVIYHNSSYFELLNTDLTFNSYILNDLPDGIKDIQTVNINDDGTDEIYCIYSDKIIICELEDVVDIDETSEPQPYIPLTNYPNPFNIYTMISYHLQAQAEVKLEIYDILGRKVETLVNSTQSAGNYQALWYADDVPSGVYFYKLTTDEHTQTKKMVLTK